MEGLKRWSSAAEGWSGKPRTTSSYVVDLHIGEDAVLSRKYAAKRVYDSGPSYYYCLGFKLRMEMEPDEAAVR
jgi:hypothetical protein